MRKGTISESADVGITVKSEHSWDEKVSAVRKSGIHMARELRQRGHKFHAEILAPGEMRGGDAVPLAGVMIELDWKVETKIQMVKSANEMITNAYLIGALDPAMPTVLTAVIEGTGLVEHGIGEFFLLYGQFEHKYQAGVGKIAREKMLKLLNGDKRYLKPYTERGKTRLEPLPLAVRNILSHVGKNPNRLEEGELRTSIDLLKSWMAPS